MGLAETEERARARTGRRPIILRSVGREGLLDVGREGAEERYNDKRGFSNRSNASIPL